MKSNTCGITSDDQENGDWMLVSKWSQPSKIQNETKLNEKPQSTGSFGHNNKRYETNILQ